MTLLVASIDGDRVWMAADTALDDPRTDLRERSYKLKVVPVQGCSLVGFAGHAETGPSAISRASSERSGIDALQVLASENRKYGVVDFAYAYMDEGQPRLFRITDGVATPLPTLHIGQPEAFETFQRIRHDHAVDHPPNAILQFLCGVADPDGDAAASRALRNTILAMQRLVLLKGDYAAGGLVIPYVLSGNGTSLCTYAFSVTDPIASGLAPGNRIPHGTAPGGGFGVSVAELREKDGIVAYWPQKPGGRVYIRQGDWYSEHEFEGVPTTFRDSVRRVLGREVDVWFGDEAVSAPESVTALYDQRNRPRIAVSQAGRVIWFDWIQSTEDSFIAESQVLMDGKTKPN